MNIESWAAFASAIAAMAAVIISVLTLKQNNKMLYEANKPVIEMYIYVVDIKLAHKYLVIKNFGKTPARITSIRFNKTLDRRNEYKRLSSLTGATIAPNQSFSTAFDLGYSEKVTATVSYTSDFLKHEETREYVLNFSQFESLTYTQLSSPNMSEESKAIINSVESLIKAIK